MDWNMLVPRPRRVETAEGRFRLPEVFRCHAETEGSLAALQAAMDFVGYPIRPVSRASEAHIRLRHRALQSDYYSMEIPPDGPIEVQVDSEHGTEGAASAAWILAAGIVAAGATRKKAANAEHTEPAAEANASGSRDLPAARISDGPRHVWRGVMVDSARQFFPLPVLKRFIDLAALHRLNVFHWHLTDDQGWRFESRTYPRLTEIGAWRDDNTANYAREGGYYSQGEMQEIDRYARVRGIRIVPEIDIPGHVRAALAAYPNLSCRRTELAVPRRFGIFEDVLCVGNVEVHRFLESIFSEVAEVFSGDLVHIGGDECPTSRWQECPRCTERLRVNSATDYTTLHADALRIASRALAAAGKRPVCWDEALDSAPPEEAIIMCWRNPQAAARALELDHEVVLCPTDRACYFDHAHTSDPNEPGRIGVCSVEDVAEFAPESHVPEDRAHRLLGAQGNLWTEGLPFGKWLEYMAFPRLAMLADTLWLRSEEVAGAGERGPRIRAHAERLADIGVNVYRGPYSEVSS